MVPILDFPGVREVIDNRSHGPPCVPALGSWMAWILSAARCGLILWRVLRIYVRGCRRFYSRSPRALAPKRVGVGGLGSGGAFPSILGLSRSQTAGKPPLERHQFPGMAPPPAPVPGLLHSRARAGSFRLLSSTLPESTCPLGGPWLMLEVSLHQPWAHQRLADQSSLSAAFSPRVLISLALRECYRAPFPTLAMELVRALEGGLPQF